MGTAKILIFLAAAGLAACAAAVTLKVNEGTEYYYGRVSFLSPDGRLPYGNTESAVKREIAAGGARITETVTQPAPSPSMKPETIVTVMTRRRKTLVYDAADAGKTFSGTLTFLSPDLGSWTYDIKLASGGTIKGKGSIVKKTLATDKQLEGVKRPMRIKEELKAVSEDMYRVRLSQFNPPGGAE